MIRRAWKIFELLTSAWQRLHRCARSPLPAHLDPVPSAETLRIWFDRERVPRFKSNPSAKRGGGPVYYSVLHVERLLRDRLLPGKLRTRETQTSN